MRKMTWVIVVWSAVAYALMALPALVALDGGTDFGASVAASIVVFFTVGLFVFPFWFVGFVVLAIVWFMSRPAVPMGYLPVAAAERER